MTIFEKIEKKKHRNLKNCEYTLVYDTMIAMGLSYLNALYSVFEGHNCIVFIYRLKGKTEVNAG